MDLSAVDGWESAVLSVKSKKQIRAAQDYGLCTLRGTQASPNREQYAPLRVGSPTGHGHLDVGI